MLTCFLTRTRFPRLSFASFCANINTRYAPHPTAMSDMEDDEYGTIADEDMIDVFSQTSQSLPPHPGKRSRNSEEEEVEDDDEIPERSKRRRRTSGGSGSGISDNEAEDASKSKKKKYMIHIADRQVPTAKILGATQAEELAALPDSSPYRIRGPIYMKPRREPTPPPPPPPPLFRAPARPSITQPNITTRRDSNPIVIEDDEYGLADLPSDAFSSEERDMGPGEPFVIGSSPLRPSQTRSLPGQRLVAPQAGLRQTTLFGGRAPDEVPASQVQKRYNFIKDKPPEEPTHHALNEEALKTWVYPLNLGDIRDYQYSIVSNGLYNNLLVALPTGLGKTCIAATIMLNFYRWTKDAKIVFVAPTKPLVAQQVDACFNIVGIPKSQTTMLTGEQAPALRAEEWADKRVFFMTPQTLENDLSSGIADSKKIVLLVVDEAHRATGNYAYVKVVKFIRRFNKSFRILALTATPGSSVESVQEVIDNLEISKVEIRTEESLDIRQYVHRREIEQILLDPSDEIILIKEHFSKALQPLVNQLCGMNAYYNKDPMALTPFGLMQARKKWMGSAAGKSASMGSRGMANSLFQILASIAHSIKLLNFHGISAFYSGIKDFRQGVQDANKPSKYRNMIVEHQDFRKMMDRISSWIGKDDFIGHPKLTYLCDTILNHFLDAGEGRLGEDVSPATTRVIVFSEFRDSAEDICRVLNKHGPMIRATVFVGQQDSKRSEGMNQVKQLETLAKFKSGVFNVIVATSIGEEGLDIGQVDLIVCYDASGSPIRMLQRMGRTGRKRKGKIVLLLMKGKEEESFAKAKDNYEQMQKMISSGERFAFRHDLSVRILPKEIQQRVDKKLIEIPPENSQGDALPLPNRRATKLKKKPPKKFSMPDGVETGFTKASRLTADGTPQVRKASAIKNKKSNDIELAPMIPAASVFLTPAQQELFERDCLQVAYGGNDIVEIGMPDLTMHPISQRSLAPNANVPHGELTRRSVTLFRKMSSAMVLNAEYGMLYGKEEGSRAHWRPRQLVEHDSQLPPPKPQTPRARKTPVPKKTPAPKKTPVPKAKKAVAAKKAKNKAPPNAARRFLDALSDDSEAEESVNASSSAMRGRTRRSSVAGDDSEGVGDEVGSEARSEDSDEDLGSLKDFLASGDGVMTSSPVMARSKARPGVEPVSKRGNQMRFLEDSDEEEEDELGHGGVVQERVPEAEMFATDDDEEEEEEIRPPSRYKEKKGRRVVDDDSDE